MPPPYTRIVPLTILVLVLCESVDNCRMNTKEKRQFIQEYMTADADKKIEMEKKYGGAKLRLMANQLLDDQYLKDNAKKCPNCNAYIQKIEGCNKMTCSKYVFYLATN